MAHEKKKTIPRLADGSQKLYEKIFLAGLLTGNLALVWRFFSLPFTHVFSAPVVPLLTSIIGLFGVEFDTAARWVLLVFYIISPLTLYFFVRELTGRRMSAGIAAIFFSLPLFRSRFEALVVSGDGAHVASLVMVPLVAFWLVKFLKKGSFPMAIATSFGTLLVALTSPFGLFTLLGVLLVVTFSEMLLGTGRIKFLRFLLVLVFSVGLTAFWYNPEFVRLTIVSAPGRAVMAALKNLIPISFFTIPILGSFGFLIFDKRAHLQPLFVALGLTIVFGLISFAGGLAKFAVSAQSRYLPEVSLALSMLWGVVGAFLYDLVGILPKSKWFPVPQAKRALVQKGISIAFVVIVLVLAIALPLHEAAMRQRGRLVSGVTESVVIGIGEIRDRTGGIHRVVGYAITTLTVFAMGGMYFWLKKEETQI